MCLHENRDAIERAGYDLAYPGRDDIASGHLALSLPSPRHGWASQAKFSARVARKVAFHSPDPDRPLIVSEENIPGKMIHFFSGHFYPAAETRLDALKEGLGGAEVAAAILVLRPYDALYRSAYRKRAEDQRSDPFTAAVPHLMDMDRGWPDLIEITRRALSPRVLHVVEYGARGRSTELLQRLVPGLVDLQLTEPARRVNRSATDAALHALQARYAAGEPVDRSEKTSVIDAHAQSEGHAPMTHFTPEQIATLTERYEADLDLIHHMKNVHLIR